MKTILHKSTERGFVNHGWLKSFHSFSFGTFQDKDKMNFGALRVLNDDTVAAGMGFGTHPHNNMEIVSIPTFGDLEHKDSTGRHEIIRQNDVQIMSAGSGISHSEFNHNKDKAVEFFQIWIFPKEKNIAPRYEQKTFSPNNRINDWQFVVSPTHQDAIWINQDAYFALTTLEKGNSISYNLQNKQHGVYVFVIDGEVVIDNQTLAKRDALGLWELEQLQLTAQSQAQILLIEIPMEFSI